ncbi:MAG: di-heme oxidoredictase family protein [Burkholderiales bacterium]
MKPLPAKTLMVLGMTAAALIVPESPVDAGLTDITETQPAIVGGQIGKSLQQQIGAGQGDVNTPGASIYLIKRDPARSIRRGRQLFHRKFTRDQGHGPRASANSIGNIQLTPRLGAGLADSCTACHARPKGSAGFGGDVVTRPDTRDAPHLFGLGLIEMLADEITANLRGIRNHAHDQARIKRAPVTLPLAAKGIEYGSITVFPDGSVDTSQVKGVNPDLRVRPFFHHGSTASIREFVIGAFKDEMGLESPDPLLCAATDSSNPIRVQSPSGMVFDPKLDRVERPPVCQPGEDGDFDGVANEIDPALIDHLEFYLLNYFKPGRGEITQDAEQGLKLIQKIGCTSCHLQNLTIKRDRRVADLETAHDPDKGIFNRLFATLTARFAVQPDGNTYPQLLPAGEAFVVENIFADFKRHDLGPNFHERNYDGTLTKEFMTEPLWGVGSTSPYGHDGRSINLKEVILRHGGEAQAARDAFAALGENRQRKVVDFLETLVLFPPEETASNLNPGNPGTTNPQDPAEHGGVTLGVLFQIPAEGAE